MFVLSSKYLWHFQHGPGGSKGNQGRAQIHFQIPWNVSFEVFVSLLEVSDSLTCSFNLDDSALYRKKHLLLFSCQNDRFQHFN